MIEQCAILLGGLGTRLGELTRETPKPLLSVGDRAFVELLIREAWRMGFRKVLLLAGYKSERVETMIELLRADLPLGCSIDISIEPEPLGTGGAVVNALPHLDERFLLINGDTWFDFNWNRLIVDTVETNAAIGIREVPLADRYETILVDDEGAATGVVNRGEAVAAPYYVNGGVYCFARVHFLDRPNKFSLEADLLPALAAAGQLKTHLSQGYFLDIGIPETYARSQIEIPARCHRPVVLMTAALLRSASAETVSAIGAANEAGFVVLGVGLNTPEVTAINALLRPQGAHIDGGVAEDVKVLEARTALYQIDVDHVAVLTDENVSGGFDIDGIEPQILRIDSFAALMSGRGQVK